MTKKDREYIDSLVKRIQIEVKRYEYIMENGTGERFWTDGHAIELVVNHITHEKRQLREFCEERDIPLPEGYYIPTPPRQSKLFMVKRDKRFAALDKEYQGRLTLRKVPYNDSQTSMF